ncbi:MAG: hypothetical protein JWO87_2000 [Phycisphaerales bacterium]|nr:hypothetical protein [Phycisphaerales bacterium]
MEITLPARLCEPGVEFSHPKTKEAPATAAFVSAVCIPLFAALAVAKAFAYGQWMWASLRFPVKWAIVSFHDLLVVIVWAAVGFALIYPIRKRPRLAKTIRRAYLVGSIGLVLYGIANIWVYSALRMPLTYSLLMMAGDTADMRSSVTHYVTFPAIAAVLCGPLAYLGAVSLLLRRAWLGRRWVQGVLLLVLCVYGPVGAYGYSHWYAGGPEDGLAQSPHWALLRSCVERWRGEGASALRDVGPRTYRDEFKTAAGRPPGRSVAPRNSPIKNVIVVVLESTSTQFLSVYGSKYPTTPSLVAEEENSLIFHNYYSNAGYTTHAMMPLVLSLYPGTGWKVYPVTSPHLSGTSVAEVFRNRGSRTAFMTPAYLEFNNMRRFFDNRGFDVVAGGEDFEKLGMGVQVTSWGLDDPPMFRRMIDWIDQEPGRPFYLLAWTQQTHHPYTPATYQHATQFANDQPGERGQMLNNYLNAIHVADEQLGRLFAALRQRNLADETLVIITGDHGEAFGFPHPWMFHGTALYQESVNVPCIFWNPKLFGKGSHRSETVGAHVDLNPTILDLLGQPLPVNWQGTSLFDPDRPQRCFFSCNTGNLLDGLREENWKFIYNVTLAREELYDLASDPTEQKNLASQQPARSKIYRERLAAWAHFEREHLGGLSGGEK